MRPFIDILLLGICGLMIHKITVDARSIRKIKKKLEIEEKLRRYSEQVADRWADLYSNELRKKASRFEGLANARLIKKSGPDSSSTQH